MMRVLLDTNIIIHREASTVKISNIGVLFKWLDRLKFEKCVHPITLDELNKHLDKKVANTMSIKVDNYNVLKTTAPLANEIQSLILKDDKSENDINDSKLLNELFCDRVDMLISEDKKIHSKAATLGIADKVFKIHQFLEKVISENPEMVDYKVLSIKKSYFGNIDLKDSFFDTFREDYAAFDKWFNKKSDESAYICYTANKQISAFLYIKVEDGSENYVDILPQFTKKKRLKIGTLKVTNNGIKIGERFLKIIFDHALLYKVEEIYVTIFNKRSEQQRLIQMFQDWGFIHHGIKSGRDGNEEVYLRPFDKNVHVNIQHPKLTFPFKGNQYLYCTDTSSISYRTSS